MPIWLSLADFLGGLITLALGLDRSPLRTVRFGSPGGFACQDRLLRPSTVYSVRRRRFPSRVTTIAHAASIGILTDSSICLAFRLIIRFRLTPGRLTSPGNPWSYGEGESHPLYRYLYLHLLFLTLHRGSRLRLRRGQECSPTDPMDPAASAHSLIPDYYPCPIPRLVSCYALFE